jgi:hypothetical protein
VAVELDMDHCRQRMTRRAFGQQSDIGCDGATRAQAADAARHHGRRASDLLGQNVRCLEIVPLQQREQRALDLVEQFTSFHRVTLYPYQKLASRRANLPNARGVYSEQYTR